MITMSFDDGAIEDIRVANLSKKYEIETVFYWPVEWHSLAHFKGYQPLRIEHAREIALDFEIGSHTITHRLLTDIPPVQARYEILASKYMLGDFFDKYPSKFAPPRGYTNEELTDFTLRHYESQRLTKGDNLVHIHPNSGANNNQDWKILAIAKKDNIHLWGHSWELTKYDLWNELEEFLNERA